MPLKSRAQRRRLATGSAALVGTMALALVPAGSADATPYRFWSYWKWTGSSWTFMNVGPQGNLPAGTVIGWRFAIQQDSASASSPRADGDFAALCGNASSGIGVVVDYGIRSDAPSGESPPRSTPRGFCATKPDDTNGYRATAEHAVLRVNGSGLVCGIDGYPKTECGATVVATASPTPSPPPVRVTRQTRKHAGPATTATSPPPDDPPTAGAPDPTRASPAPARPGHSSPASPAPSPTLDVGAPAPTSSTHGGTPLGLIVGLAAAAALACGALWRFRSRA